MLYDSDVKFLKKYRHIIASLISYSTGYFTPIMAYCAIEHYLNNTPYFCEWYFHIANLRGLNDDNSFISINRDIIKRAVKRHHSYDLKRCLNIVDLNINGHESLGASWF